MSRHLLSYKYIPTDRLSFSDFFSGERVSPIELMTKEDGWIYGTHDKKVLVLWSIIVLQNNGVTILRFIIGQGMSYFHFIYMFCCPEEGSHGLT